RCQVFDFRRIQLSDITRHLASIAQKEGITAEPQALHVIAQKADGGLRDALSIFDQLVSFAGDQLTYQAVVQNLNVLDHEHYFRITDSIIAGDVAAALVEFNAILQQGFDGHLFVSGLARHFRDLLVSQDPRTLSLLEVSEDLTQRYGLQARNAPRDLLVKGLDRLAQCDAQYKQSKEPRLLVELLLIQLCRLTAAEADPEKKSPDASVTPVRTPAPPPAAAIAPPAPAPTATVAAAPVATPSPAATATDAYAPKRRILREQVSIKPTAAPAVADPALGAAASTKEVNPSLLQTVWREYAQRCKQQGRNSLHATLVAREPAVAGPGRITFAIVNEVQENYLREEKPELLGFLRRQLGDPGLDMEVIKEEVVVKPRYTALDRFRLLAEKNPALITLKNEVDLDLG
ncbi:MAG TPA: DNA polymerase III subunit gamma/tau, partial [Flavobacteriales bacterium]|nr:DNA polymerase III subunit gamma/tau [Flavobacteriales bacterium]